MEDVVSRQSSVCPHRSLPVRLGRCCIESRCFVDLNGSQEFHSHQTFTGICGVGGETRLVRLAYVLCQGWPTKLSFTYSALHSGSPLNRPLTKKMIVKSTCICYIEHSLHTSNWELPAGHILGLIPSAELHTVFFSNTSWISWYV